MGSWTQWWAWKHVHNLKGNITGDLTIPGHDNNQRWNEAIACFFWTQRSQSPVWSVLKKMVPLICCYMHTSKWFLFATAGIISDKSLRSFRHVLSCTTVILYYAVEMYVYLSDDCQAWHYFWISLTCQLGHSNWLMILAAVGWDAWLLTRVRFRRLDFRGGNSKLSLRITSFLNSKALLRYYNLQVFSSSCHQDLFCHMQSCLQGVGS
jgi:hypothetical protein